ncbi:MULTISPECIES: hypothetical protein [Bifidobacterium]|uniref:hypothetical protein n=1 Tax=Bifidobacterium TaxID=1678 RepID=UPI00101FCF4E|nr:MULTISPECIES: hypothetical protein [Bifidobacterium]MEE0972119.1 hypothetical protein [Bifidobacterium ruminantium]MEE1201407.1 hypothetical protein [Bifidobacterium sp.]
MALAISRLLLYRPLCAGASRRARDCGFPRMARRAGVALSREMFLSDTLELDDAVKTVMQHQANALIGMVTEQ